MEAIAGVRIHAAVWHYKENSGQWETLGREVVPIGQIINIGPASGPVFSVTSKIAGGAEATFYYKNELSLHVKLGTMQDFELIDQKVAGKYKAIVSSA